MRLWNGCCRRERECFSSFFLEAASTSEKEYTVEMFQHRLDTALHSAAGSPADGQLHCEHEDDKCRPGMASPDSTHAAVFVDAAVQRALFVQSDSSLSCVGG